MSISDFTLVVNDNISVDTIPLFIQLAADTTSAYKDIDLLYETDKTRFQYAVTSSVYADHPLFTTGGIDRGIYALKYSGIILAAIQDGVHSPLFEKACAIMTKRWHELYCYITNCETVDLSEVTKPRYCIESSKNKNYNLLAGATAVYVQSFITLYPTIDTPLHAALKISMFLVCAFGKKLTVSEIATLSIIGLLGSKIDSTSELQLLKKQMSKATVNKIARDLKNVIFQKVFQNYLDPWQNDRRLESWAQCNAYLASAEGISLLSPKLLIQPKERDVELLCRMYIIKLAAETMQTGQVIRNKEGMEFDCAEFVMFGLILLEFVREYKKTRKYYFEQNAAHLCSEVEQLKKQLNEYELEIRKLNADLVAKNELLLAKEDKINSLIAGQEFVLNSVMKENEHLKSKFEKREEHRETLTNIRKLQTKHTEIINTQSLDVENSLKVLDPVHALVIGGAENWQAKLKNKLSHFNYLEGDATNFDEELIIHADIIFVNVRCKFSHNCFYKLIRLVRQHGKRLVFLTKTNISLTIHEMANAADNSFVA